jgi:hypothetical protein
MNRTRRVIAAALSICALGGAAAAPIAAAAPPDPTKLVECGWQPGHDGEWRCTLLP